MTEAILTFTSSNISSHGIKLKKRKLIHWAIQVLAGCSITAAFVIIIMNNNRSNRDHFTSDHGIAGLTTIICTVASMFGGVATLYAYELQCMHPILLKILHAFFGTCAYILAIATIILGLNSEVFQGNVSNDALGGCIAAVVLVAVYTIVHPLVKVYGRVKSI